MTPEAWAAHKALLGLVEKSIPQGLPYSAVQRRKEVHVVFYSEPVDKAFAYALSKTRPGTKFVGCAAIGPRGGYIGAIVLYSESPGYYWNRCILIFRVERVITD